MRRIVLLTLTILSLTFATPRLFAQKEISVASLVAELKKSDGEKLKAIEALDAMGEKAAEAAPALIGLFEGKNEDVRIAATIALGKIGKAAVEPLAKALESKEVGVRFYSVWSLAFIGTPAKTATPAVVKAMSDPSADVRRKAAYALGRIDADPTAVVDVLVSALADGDNDVRQTAASSLPKMSKTAVPVLMKAIKGDKADLKAMAVKILGDIGSDASAAVPDLRTILLENGPASPAAADALASIGAVSIKALTDAAGHDNANVRGMAIRSLHRIGAPAVPTFVDLLGAKHVDVQRQVAQLLGGMLVQDKSVVIGLGFATKDKDFQVRFNALQSLQQMGSGAKLAEPYVVALLTDLDPQIRLNAFHTLRSIGVDPQPGLKKALAHDDARTRITTASLMVELNFEVALAEPVLLEGVKHADEALRTQAAYALALRGLQADVVLPIFIAALKNEIPSVRRQAAQMIARYGKNASKASQVLIDALDDKDDAVSGAALKTLQDIGADPKTLFPAMVKILRRPDTKMHGLAAQIVFQVGPNAIPQVIEMLKKEDASGVRLACLQTLAMVGPPAKDAVGELVKTLNDPSAGVRMTAARALGNIGPDAKGAVDPLKKLTNDADANVRQIASAALVQIMADPNQKEFEVKGVLTSGDPMDKVRGGCFHVVHTYPMVKGKMYTILLNSQWDNFLRLENPQGVTVAQDDDGQGFPNARILYTAPEDGWYRIIVTSFSGGASGPYTLRVK